MTHLLSCILLHKSTFVLFRSIIFCTTSTMRSQPIKSKKRPANQFAQEVEFKAKKSRRGGQRLQAVPAAITTQQGSSSSNAPPLSKQSSAPPMSIPEHQWSQDLLDEHGSAKRKTGQVSFFQALMVTPTS
jgi:hypothetical protein